MSQELAIKTGGAASVAFVMPALAQLPFDAWWLVFLPLGLMLGWSARAGKMLGENKPWTMIRRDLFVSLLIGGANALLAAVVIAQFHLAYLPGVAVAFVCAFGGVQTLQAAVDWGWRQFVNDAAAHGRKRQEAQRMAGENRLRDQHEHLPMPPGALPQDMRDLLNKLDDDDDR